MTEKHGSPKKKQSLLRCLFEEVVKGSAVGEDDTNYLIKEQQIITFINIPCKHIILLDFID